MHDINIKYHYRPTSPYVIITLLWMRLGSNGRVPSTCEAKYRRDRSQPARRASRRRPANRGRPSSDSMSSSLGRSWNLRFVEPRLFERLE